MPRFSLILPCLQPDSAFEDSLASLLRTKPSVAEVVVVHDGSYRDDYGLAGEVEFAVASKRRLVSFWNAGLEASGGEFILWVRPGVQLDDGWEHECLRAFENPLVGCVAPKLHFQTSGPEQLLTGISISPTGTRSLNIASRQSSIGPSSWIAAYRQSALGWLEPLDLVWEDEYLDAFLALAIQRMGYQFQLAADWDALLDGPVTSEVLRQSPHGLSAARATVRFGRPLASGLSAGLREDLAHLFRQPWRLRHLRSRLKAARFQSADRYAAEELTQRLARRQQILAQSSQSTRRAA